MFRRLKKFFSRCARGVKEDDLRVEDQLVPVDDTFQVGGGGCIHPCEKAPCGKYETCRTEESSCVPPRNGGTAVCCSRHICDPDSSYTSGFHFHH